MSEELIVTVSSGYDRLRCGRRSCRCRLDARGDQTHEGKPLQIVEVALDEAVRSLRAAARRCHYKAVAEHIHGDAALRPVGIADVAALAAVVPVVDVVPSGGRARNQRGCAVEG